jgi:hypothetical protein
VTMAVHVPCAWCKGVGARLAAWPRDVQSGVPLALLAASGAVGSAASSGQTRAWCVPPPSSLVARLSSHMLCPALGTALVSALGRLVTAPPLRRG